MNKLKTIINRWKAKFKREIISKEEAPFKTKEYNFQSLTPTSDADKNNIYCKALEEVIGEDNHFNIALTGGYGTGKSSIVETFLTKSKEYKHENVLRISLASFNLNPSDKEKKPIRPSIFGKSTTQAEDQISLEISLLQQFVLQIKDEKLKRLFLKEFNEEKNNLEVGVLSFIILLTIIAQMFFWSPLLTDRLFQFPKFLIIANSYPFKWIVFLIAFGGAGYLLFRVIKFIYQNKIRSIQLDKVSFDIDSKNEVSLLNSYIEELIHLFKSSDFKLVILEDLDRFEDYDIFEKLREVNHILRYSPELKDKRIKFLYVVRESIFKNENEKNKFFDIILPVVPFISTKNSKAEMLKLFKAEKNSIDNQKQRDRFENIIKLSALSIDEMRTLKSIYNDYVIYLKIIEKNDKKIIKVNKPELLAMMIYKNLFPKDFEDINSGVSLLEKILDLRKEFMHRIIAIKEKEIPDLRSDLLEIQNEPNESLKLLRAEYINAIRFSLKINESFTIQNLAASISQNDLLEEENFEKLILNGYSVNHINKPFSDLEKLIQNPKKYDDRVKLIIEKQKQSVSIKKNSIKLINNEIETIKSSSFSIILNQVPEQERVRDEMLDILRTKKEDSQYDDIPYKHKLLVSFLRYGFITLGFKHYTSVFHDGDISHKDREVLTDFQSGKKIDFEQQFNNPRSFLDEFIPSDWNSLIYLNFQLFDLILYEKKYENNFKSIVRSESDYLLEFLNEYIFKTNNIKKLAEHIFQNWDSFTFQALNSKDFDNETFDLLITYLLSFRSIDEVNKQNKEGVLSEYILEKKNISNVFPSVKSRVSADSILKSFRTLDAKFHQIQESEKTWILELIYENNLYEVNFRMLELWSEVYAVDYIKLLTYTGIRSCELKPLQSYIDEKINNYVENILLSLETKKIEWEEDEEGLKRLLNHKNLKSENKNAIIVKVNFHDFNLSSYSEDLWSPIIWHQKLKGSWDNFIRYHEKNGMTEAFIKLFNNSDNLINLDKYPRETNEIVSDDKVKDFIQNLLQEVINQDSLVMLKNNFGYFVQPSLLSLVTQVENIRTLINQKAFNPKSTDEVYDVLKEYFMDELLHLEFAKEYQEAILSSEEPSIYFNDLTKEEVLFVIENKFKEDYIIKVLAELDDFDEIVFSEYEAKKIEEVVMRFEYVLNNNLLLSILRSLPAKEQSSYFVWLYKKGVIEKDTLNEFLITFKGDLKEIHKPKKGFTIDNNRGNVEFLDLLKKMGLVKQYKPIKKETKISFRRNHNEVEIW